MLQGCAHADFGGQSFEEVTGEVEDGEVVEGGDGGGNMGELVVIEVEGCKVIIFEECGGKVLQTHATEIKSVP